MRQVVINTSYGGFHLSDEAIELYGKYSGLDLVKKGKHYSVGDIHFYDRNIKRDDENLVKVVLELKEKADGFCSKLKVIEIPIDVEYEIEEYDGNEWVAEKHRTWN